MHLEGAWAGRPAAEHHAALGRGAALPRLRKAGRVSPPATGYTPTLFRSAHHEVTGVRRPEGVLCNDAGRQFHDLVFDVGRWQDYAFMRDHNIQIRCVWFNNSATVWV